MNNTNDDPEKRAKILGEIDSYFHHAERASGAAGGATHLDVLRIAERVRSHYDSATPAPVESALQRATDECEPERIERLMGRRRMIAFALAVAGALLLVIGIMTGITDGVSTVEDNWWFVDALKYTLGGEWETTLNLGAPILIVLGVALIALAVYQFSLRAPLRSQAASAHKLMREPFKQA